MCAWLRSNGEVHLIGPRELRNSTMYLKGVQIKQNALLQDRDTCHFVHIFGIKIGCVPIVALETDATIIL